MNSVQAEILLRVIDKLEREACTDIIVVALSDSKDHLWLHLEFCIPVEPGEQPVQREMKSEKP